VTLEKAATSFTGNVQAALSNSTTVTMGPALATEDIVKNVNAAVLFLSGSHPVRIRLKSKIKAEEFGLAIWRY
jgi:hypothetical protein